MKKPNKYSILFSVLSLCVLLSSCSEEPFRANFKIDGNDIISVDNVAGNPSESDVMIVTQGEPVAFLDASIGNGSKKVRNRKWNFGDGNIDTVKYASVYHVFSKPADVLEIELCLDDLGCISKYVKVVGIDTEEEVIAATEEEEVKPDISNLNSNNNELNAATKIEEEGLAEAQRLADIKVAEAVAAEKKRLATEQEAIRAAEVQRLADIKAAEAAAAEKKRLATEQEAIRAAEAQRLVDIKAAEAAAAEKKRLATEQEAIRAAEVQRLADIKAAEAAAAEKKRLAAEQRAIEAAEAQRLADIKAAEAAAAAEKKRLATEQEAIETAEAQRLADIKAAEAAEKELTSKGGIAGKRGYTGASVLNLDDLNTCKDFSVQQATIQLTANRLIALMGGTVYASDCGSISLKLSGNGLDITDVFELSPGKNQLVFDELFSVELSSGKIYTLTLTSKKSPNCTNPVASLLNGASCGKSGTGDDNLSVNYAGEVVLFKIKYQY